MKMSSEYYTLSYLFVYRIQLLIAQDFLICFIFEWPGGSFSNSADWSHEHANQLPVTSGIRVVINCGYASSTNFLVRVIGLPDLERCELRTSAFLYDLMVSRNRRYHGCVHSRPFASQLSALHYILRNIAKNSLKMNVCTVTISVLEFSSLYNKSTRRKITKVDSEGAGAVKTNVWRNSKFGVRGLRLPAFWYLQQEWILDHNCGIADDLLTVAGDTYSTIRFSIRFQNVKGMAEIPQRSFKRKTGNSATAKVW